VTVSYLTTRRLPGPSYTTPVDATAPVWGTGGRRFKSGRPDWWKYACEAQLVWAAILYIDGRGFEPRRRHEPRRLLL
jgi:hypothetical protein